MMKGRLLPLYGFIDCRKNPLNQSVDSGFPIVISLSRRDRPVIDGDESRLSKTTDSTYSRRYLLRGSTRENCYQ